MAAELAGRARRRRALPGLRQRRPPRPGQPARRRGHRRPTSAARDEAGRRRRRALEASPPTLQAADGTAATSLAGRPPTDAPSTAERRAGRGAATTWPTPRPRPRSRSARAGWQTAGPSRRAVRSARAGPGSRADRVAPRPASAPRSRPTCGRPRGSRTTPIAPLDAARGDAGGRRRRPARAGRRLTRPRRAASRRPTRLDDAEQAAARARAPDADARGGRATASPTSPRLRPRVLARPSATGSRRLLTTREAATRARAAPADARRRSTAAGDDDAPAPDRGRGRRLPRCADGRRRPRPRPTAALPPRRGAAHEPLTALRARLDVGARRLGARCATSTLRAEAMSRLVRGMGHDNQLQMRLSSYVLATRLDQVLDAANERLGHMRDQRYLLQRTGRAARTAQPGRPRARGRRPVDRRRPRPGDAVRRRDLRGVAVAGARAGRRGHPGGRRHRDRDAVRRRGLRHARRRHPRRRDGPPRRPARRRPHRRRGQPRQRAAQPHPDPGARRTRAAPAPRSSVAHPRRDERRRRLEALRVDRR